jgi:hypothetical protein
VAPLESIAGYQPSAVLSTSTPSRIGASITAPRGNRLFVNEGAVVAGGYPRPRSCNGVFDAEEHLAVKVAWLIYQKIIAAYAETNRRRGKTAMSRLIDSIRRGVPAGLEENAQLGRTLWRRRADILAFFDHHASNGPTEAICECKCGWSTGLVRMVPVVSLRA